jgi:phytoene desaturase
MPAKSVAIIGAGLAGLSAGVYARLNGYEAHILEHHCQPGGVAAAWRRDPYLIDGGIHFLMGHRPGQPMYDLYEEVGATRGNRFLDMREYGRFIDEASGSTILLTADLDRFAVDLKNLAPADAGAIDGLIKGARAFQRSNAFADMGDPPEIAGPLAPLKMMWGMRHLLRYMGGQYGQSVADYTRSLHDPILRQVVNDLFLPEVPVWFVLALLGMLAEGQIGLLESGSRGFVDAIEAHYRELGGEVTYNATVEEILVENDRAVGVRLADGTTHRADAVVAAGDGRRTVFELLGGRYVDEKTRTRYEDWALMRPLFMVSWGVAREFGGEPHETTYRLAEPLTVAGSQISGFFVRLFNYSPLFAPPGKTVIQAAFETEWDYWQQLRDRPQAYEAEKQRVADELLARLEKHYPGLALQVEVTDAATPYTMWRYTLNHKGSYEGWLPTGKTLTATLPRTLPGLSDFYMAGQWVMPGGGVPPCLYSGRQAIQIMCQRDGRPFVSRGPGKAG